MSESTVEQARNIAGQFCGQAQPHKAHVWQTPVPFGTTAISVTRQCAGAMGEVPPGPCWHDSGHSWPGETFTVRCDLLAGHAGAHQAERPMGGTAVWTSDDSTTPTREKCS